MPQRQSFVGNAAAFFITWGFRDRNPWWRRFDWRASGDVQLGKTLHTNVTGDLEGQTACTVCTQKHRVSHQTIKHPRSLESQRSHDALLTSELLRHRSPRSRQSHPVGHGPSRSITARSQALPLPSWRVAKPTWLSVTQYSCQRLE